MSGIAGVFYRDRQPVEPALLERLSARLAHRGADGQGAWHAGPVGLVHRLFCTTPESRHEQQPVSAPRPAGAIVLTADARIDNRAELAGPLGLPDAPNRPDSAFILAAYEKWGEACPEHLVGDFAFAIWDGPRHLLFCARDAMGTKTLFYFDAPEVFAFASEIKGVFALPQVPRAPCNAQIAAYLAHRVADPALTFYAAVRRLLPGCSLTITASGSHLRRYWSIDLERELRLPSDDEYAQAFREIFTEAVRCRLRSAYPIGALFSGGLDSSSVTSVARQLMNGQPLQTFSIIFDQARQSDERVYMREMVAADNPTHCEVSGDGLSPLFEIDRVLWHLEEPFRNLGVYFQWLLYQAAQTRGVRVLLSGNGGDGLVSYGLFRLAELTRDGHWVTLIRELRDFAAARSGSWRMAWWAWKEYGGRPLAPTWARQARRAMRGRGRPAWSANSFINPEFARQIEASQGVIGFPAQPRTQRQDHWLGVAQNIRWSDLYERAAPAWQIDPRHPLMDRRLAEFCVSLPAEQKFRQGQTRRIFRQAMRGVLPEAIRQREDKATPLYSMAPAFLRNDRERLEASLLKQNEALRPYVDLPAVAQAYRSLPATAARSPLEYWPKLSELVQITMLARWLQLDPRAPQPVEAATPG